MSEIFRPQCSFLTIRVLELQEKARKWNEVAGFGLDRPFHMVVSRSRDLGTRVHHPTKRIDYKPSRAALDALGGDRWRKNPQ